MHIDKVPESSRVELVNSSTGHRFRGSYYGYHPEVSRYRFGINILSDDETTVFFHARTFENYDVVVVDE